MGAECNRESFGFHALGRRDVVAIFDGGPISSDTGGLLLRETERLTQIIRQFATCFTDHRDPDRIDHTVGELIAQRVYALALGYEDLNDHDDLRHDPLLAAMVDKKDPLGRTRGRERDRGKALAGKSTLNRLELTPVRADAGSRYKKITLGLAKNERLAGEIENELAQAKSQYDATQQPARVSKDFRYQTLKSWSRSRRVIGKAEHLSKGANPRLWFSSVAYTLLNALRRLGLKDTSMARARCDTIRLKLLKIGSRISVTFRKVWVSMAKSCPYRRIFRQAYNNLVATSQICLRC